MTDTANSKIPGKKKRSLAIRLLRYLVFTGAGLLFLIAVLIGFTETSWFRSIVRDYIQEAADSTLTAQLTIGELSGNLFSGWKLEDVRLGSESGPILSVQSIVLRYDLLGLFGKKIPVRELTLNKPVLRITRAEGRDWNIAGLIRDTTESEEPPGEFDWTIILKNIRIVDGRLIVRDSTDPGPFPSNRLNMSNIDFDELSLAMDAVITPDSKSLSINQFYFINRLGDVSIENISGDFLLDETGSRIDDLSFQTVRTRLVTSVTVEGLDLTSEFTSEDLYTAPLLFETTALAVDLTDIQYFLPSLDMLGSTPSLSIRTSGTLDSLVVEDFNFTTLGSRVTFTGSVDRMSDASNMYINMVSENSRIDCRDLPLILPGLELPDYSQLGIVEFRDLTFTGSPENFLSTIELLSDAGDITGMVELDFRKKEMEYDCEIETHDLDLARVLRQPAFSSSLNLRGDISGRGTSLGTMQADLHVSADSSRFQRYVSRFLNTTVKVRSDSMILDLDGALGSSRLAMDGSMSFKADSVTGFLLRGEGHSLNLAKALNKDELESDLNFTIEAEGNSLSLSEASASILLAVNPSVLQDLRIYPDTLSLTLDQRNPESRELSLKSQYADITMSGRFDIPRFMELMSVQADSLTRGIAVFSIATDSAESESGLPEGETAAVAGVDSSDFMDAQYRISLKHPERIAKYFDATQFIITGEFSGNIKGGYRGLDLNGNLRIGDLYYLDEEHAYMFAGIRCMYDITDLSPVNTFERLGMQLSLSASDLNLDDLHVRGTGLRAGYAAGVLHTRFQSNLDTIMSVNLDGKALVQGDSYFLELEKLQLQYLKEGWTNDGPVHIRMDTGAVNIERLFLRRKSTLVDISGRRSFAGENNLSIRVDSLHMGEVEYLMSGKQVALEGGSFGGVSSIEAVVTGNDTEPLLALDAFISGLAYQNSVFGDFTVEGTYNDQRIEVFSRLDYTGPDNTNRRVFFASGSLPMNISFADAENVGVTGSANLRIQMMSFPLTLVERFVGMFSPLKGEANADFVIEGSADDPSYSGFLTIDDARGRFLFNNMRYLISARLETRNNNIDINSFSIANDPSEWNDGRILATGSIKMDGFSVSDFDVQMNGQLKVLHNASRSVLKTVYGNLFIGTGVKGLQLSGRPDRSRFAGSLKILNGNLTFPLENQSKAISEHSNISYVDVDDVSTERNTSLSSGWRSGDASLLGKRIGEDSASVQDAQQQAKSSAFTYDLALSTDGRLRILMPISSLTAQELNATIEINEIKADNWGGSGKFVGAVKLGSDSYYNFLGKRFDASGSLRFVGNPESPDLDLKAVYSEYHEDKSGGETRKVFVIIHITGTRKQPQISWDMRYDSPESSARPRSGNVESDALSFILFGSFTDELTSSSEDRGKIIDQADAIGDALSSTLMSAAAAEIIARAGLQDVFQRVEVGGIGTDDPRVKVRSAIGKTIITYDGKINNLESSDIAIDFPMNILFPDLGFGSMVLQASRKTSDPLLKSGSNAQETAVYELKFLYRIAF